MKTIVTTNAFENNKKLDTKFETIEFKSKKEAKEWFKKLKEDEEFTIGKTKIINKGEQLITQGKTRTYIRTIWTEKEYNKINKYLWN